MFIKIVAIFLFLILGNFSEAQEKQNKCYALGYRWGRCFAMGLAGIECNSEDDIIIPPECRHNAEKNRGLKAGIEEGQRIVNSKQR